MTVLLLSFSYERPAEASCQDYVSVLANGINWQKVLLLVFKFGVGIKDLSQVSLTTVHSDLFSLLF